MLNEAIDSLQVIKTKYDLLDKNQQLLNYSKYTILFTAYTPYMYLLTIAYVSVFICVDSSDDNSIATQVKRLDELEGTIRSMSITINRQENDVNHILQTYESFVSISSTLTYVLCMYLFTIYHHLSTLYIVPLLYTGTYTCLLT